MSTPRQSPIKDLDEKTTLRARVVELERENDLLKPAQRAHTEVGGGLRTSGTQWAPELGSLHQIYGAAPIGLCCLDTKLRFVFVNEWLAAMNGLSVKEHLGRPIFEILPDVAAGIKAQLLQVIETGEPIVEGTVTAETAAEPGVKRHFQHNYDAIRSADGPIVGVSCVVQDITERKQAEEALRESEVKYRELFESAHDVICLVDGEGKIVDINRRGELLTDYSRAELRQMNVLDQLVVPEDHAVGKQVLKRAVPEAEHVYEVRWRTKQGKIVHFEGASTYRFSASGEFMSTRCTLRDITERKRAEEHARQLQADLAHMSRLSSMGEMAAGLAHELNQPLTVITNYAQGCVRRLKSNAISGDELENVLSRIATQAQRSSSIIRGLGNLVRKSSARRTDIDVNQSIIDVAEMANAEATQHHAKARFELEPNLPLVKADQTQLQQVILNLVQNGCEATEDTPESKRAVTVRTKRRSDTELEISVVDNGRGIPESLAERLFEPFFTTKAHGIGMGLAISRSIVESHGGRLWVTPNRGEGTTFHFTLPIVGGHDGDEQ
ncbi:MAG: PAS domain S-box protein [Phycisphaerales bacterium]